MARWGGKKKVLPAQLSVQRMGPPAKLYCIASEVQPAKAGATIQHQMMVKEVSDPACGLPCPDMDSKSWKELRIWPQIAGGHSELTDSVEVAGLDLARMSHEENQRLGGCHLAGLGGCEHQAWWW